MTLQYYSTSPSEKAHDLEQNDIFGDKRLNVVWHDCFYMAIWIHRQFNAECDQHKCGTLLLGVIREKALPSKRLTGIDQK